MNNIDIRLKFWLLLLIKYFRSVVPAQTFSVRTQILYVSTVIFFICFSFRFIIVNQLDEIFIHLMCIIGLLLLMCTPIYVNHKVWRCCSCSKSTKWALLWDKPTKCKKCNKKMCNTCTTRKICNKCTEINLPGYIENINAHWSTCGKNVENKIF